MDTALKVLSLILPIVCTVFMGLLGLGFRSILSGIRDSIQKNTDDINKVETRHTELEKSFNDLKADLPIVYVLREDYVRTMNNVDSKIMRVDSHVIGMDHKLDRLLEKMPKGGNLDG